MRIHHLNCATMCPIGARLINGTGGLFDAGRLVCHCLLVESGSELILIDTGLGSADMVDPHARLGEAFVRLVRPRLDSTETAIQQLRALGFDPKDVRHIVLTHLDVDHAGGLPDFPDAQVHVYGAEHSAAMTRRLLKERERYRPVQWQHGPKWVKHTLEGDRWFGFERVRAVTSAECDVLLVPMHGHTQGHCAVAVRSGERWLLHCGDAYFFREEIDPARPHCTPGLAFFQRVVAIDNGARLRNQERLRALRTAHASEVTLLCAHDPVELDTMRAASSASSRAREHAA